MLISLKTTVATAILLSATAAFLGAAEAQQAPARQNAQQQPAQPQPPRARDLDDLSALFLYHRLNGTAPDYRALVTNSSQSYARASAFDRDTVMEREIQRFEREFTAFNHEGMFQVRLNVNIQQFDRAEGGFPIDFFQAEDRFIVAGDPSRQTEGFGVKFRNRAAARVIPTADTNAARALSERHQWAQQGTMAGQGVLEITFRAAELGEQVRTWNGRRHLIQADITRLRVIEAFGNRRLIHDFGTLQAQEPPAPAARPQAAPTAPTAPEPPALPAALRAADIQGIRLGQTMAAARVAARQEHPDHLRQSSGVGREDILVRGSQGGSLACSLQDMTSNTTSMAPGARGEGPAHANYDSCIALVPGPGDVVAEVRSGQFLRGMNPQDIAGALERKYGQRTSGVAIDGTATWVGVDPASTSAQRVEVQASIRQATKGAEQGFLLIVSLRPAAAAAAPTGPRL